MTDLPTLYAEVVAKRPEAAVKHGGLVLQHDGSTENFAWRELDGSVSWKCIGVDPYEASALILQHWLGLLPKFHSLMLIEGGWVVWNHDIAGLKRAVGDGDTPLAALAAYLIGAK